MPQRQTTDSPIPAAPPSRSDSTGRETAAGDSLRPRAVESAIAELTTVLARERAAVITLDAEAMATVIEDKQALLIRLEALAHGATDGSVEPTRGRSVAQRLRDATTRALAQAEANVALLSDATATLSELLGLRENATTYDARARLVQQVRAAAGKNV